MWGAKVRVISTHNSDEHPFNSIIKDIRAGRRKGNIHTITLDDACAEGLYKRICQVLGRVWSQEVEDEWKADLLASCMSEEDALEEYYCVPKHGSGAYIPRVLIDRAANNTLPVVRFTMPAGNMTWTEEERTKTALAFCTEQLLPILKKLNPDTRHSVGQDFARSGDLSDIGVGSIEDDTRRIMRLTVELRDVPYNQQRQILFFIIDNTPPHRGYCRG
ncbi:hypothetical protein [Limnobaculum zhutongyuii]|nr:hypothetical protein [Limnobaculum zhutongyuii]